MMDLLGRQAASAPTRTHDVTNQAPPLADYDAYAVDATLVDAVARAGAGWADSQLRAIGECAGRAETIALGFEANANPPQLRAFDRYGNRIDEVAFHPAYHALMEASVGFGFHASSWRAPRIGAHVARAAGFYLWTQVESGHGCPISMTHAAIPALRAQPELSRVWEPLAFAGTYEKMLRPATEKAPRSSAWR